MTIRRALFILILLAAVPLWSQNDATVAAIPPDIPPNSDDERMLTPPPTSGESYPLTPASEARSNYLRAGVTFDSGYSDNVLGGITAKPVSDVNYSVWPTIALDETTTRV